MSFYSLTDKLNINKMISVSNQFMMLLFLYSINVHMGCIDSIIVIGM